MRIRSPPPLLNHPVCPEWLGDLAKQTFKVVCSQLWSLCTRSVYYSRRIITMPTPRTRAHKHFRLNAAKIKRAQKVLHVGTETEAIERALDFVISEHERNGLASEATERFVKSGIAVKDVYGTLEP